MRKKVVRKSLEKGNFIKVSNNEKEEAIPNTDAADALLQ